MNKKEMIVFIFIFSLSLVFAITGFVTEGSSSSSVTIEGLRIIYDTFNGSTTDFNSLNTSELNSLSLMILERISYGKIIFNETVNLTLTGGADKVVNFDLDFNISSNLMYIDDSDLPYLNKTVTIFLYGLSYSNPQIMHNGVICSDCTLFSYSGGNLTFRASNFNGVYYARETPSVPVCGDGVCESGEDSTSCPADCSAGGGGGGGGGSEIPIVISGEPVSDFYIIPDFLAIQINRGEYFQKSIIIVNNGSQELIIGAYVIGLDEFVFPQEEVFSVKPGQNYTLRLNIYVSSSTPPDVYIGKITFDSKTTDKKINFILDIKEKGALFDIKTNITKKYVAPGRDAIAIIAILNKGELRNFDVSLEYKIMDFENNTYMPKKEDFAINETYMNSFALNVPLDLPIGQYLFYAKVSYGNVTASSYDTFIVETVSFWSWVILIIVIVVLIIIIFFILRKRRKNKKKKSEGKLVKPSLIKRKLRYPKISN